MQGLKNIQQRVMRKMRAINERYALHTENYRETSTAPWRRQNIWISGVIKSLGLAMTISVRFCVNTHTIISGSTATPALNLIFCISVPTIDRNSNSETPGASKSVSA